MSDYSEHLISMAGGGGDPLDAIQRRITDCKTYNFGMRNADKLAHEDAAYLLAIVREQRVKLDALAAIAEAPDIITRHPKGDKTFYVEAHRIRAALEPTP